MRALLCVLFITAYVLADKTDIRRNKLPFVADAVGNTLPPPSSVPATVGSPVNLLTPDRYEFYTFDESGELVKKLMTLEEIQAIVAAGEEGEGLVTFANDNQPTIAFNFSQPSYTKVHSVVTNVQNVLKAQMEAHKNRPQIQPTLDTPDVSDTWSLILPSIFGNTGVDIVPDKSSGSFTEPETDTLDIEDPSEVEENALTKEDNNQVASSSSTTVEEKTVTEKIPTTIEIKAISTTTSTTSSTTTTTTTTTTTPKPKTTRQPTIPTSTTHKPSTTIRPHTTRRPQTKVTEKLSTINISTKPSTTLKPTTITTTTTTTTKPEVTTKQEISSTSTNKEIDNKLDIQVQLNPVSSTEKNEIEYETFSTFIPVSTIKYVTERITTSKPNSTKSPIIYATTTKKPVLSVTKNFTSEDSIMTTLKPTFSTFSYISSSTKDPEIEKVNVTTITTQSVSPSTTVSSTEFVSTENMHLNNGIVENKPTLEADNENDNMPLIPLFDVAQSISQIASDLGGSYRPIPTTSNLLDTTNVDLESKENIDLDIPSAGANETDVKFSNTPDTSADNFVQISTLDPHTNDVSNYTNSKETITTNDDEIDLTIQTGQKLEVTTVSSTEETTIDPILSESMEDLLSQVVNEAPQSLADTQESSDKSDKIAPTEKNVDITTTENIFNIETTSEVALKVKKETTSATETSIEQEIVRKTKEPLNEIISNNSTTNGIAPDLTNAQITSDFDGNNVSTTTDINLHNTLTVIEQNGNERGDINFVQIPMLENNHEPKEEAQLNENGSKIQDNKNNTNVIEDLKTNITLMEEELKSDSTKVNVRGTELSSIETTTVVLTTDIPTTTVKFNSDSKFTSSKFNKLNLADKLNSGKKDRISEPLPKVDEFKKKIQKVNIAEEELISERNNSWKLVPTLSPPKVNEIPKDKQKAENHYTPDNENKEIILEYSQENQGLEVTTKDLGEDIAQFTELCNELAFRYWNVMTDNIDKRRSFVLSPYSITSMLAMMFMGAKGATSGEMNEILKLDDMVTFNPHFTLKNISDSIETTTHSGIAISAFIRELYSDRNKGKILTFYKERAQHFYNGHVEEINFKLISDIIRRRTNLLVKRYTWGKIAEFMKSNNIVMQPPLAAFSANIFQTDCTGSSVEGRDGEMYFVVSPNVRQRRLVPVPAVVYKNGFLAGYDPVLDATAAALGNTNSIISTLFLMPGQQGNIVHADDLEKLEQRLLNANPTTPTWGRLLRTLLPRAGLELQIPRFSHKSIFNVSSTLQKMGLKDLFDADHADLGGLNGPSKDLFLSDMIQLSTFVTCGEEVVGEQHHIEEYPENLGASQRRRTSRWVKYWDEPGDYQRAFHDPHDVGEAMQLPLHLRPRQARLPTRSTQPARLKFDRPFLYFVRHNPSGMILYFGRYNPRLLP